MNAARNSSLLILMAIAISLLFSSCTTRSASERRIKKNPELYAKLSSSDKERVLRGDIREGMTREAVYLAWGKPGRIMSGSKSGKTHEKWAYFSSRPVGYSSVSYGYGGYGYGGHPYYRTFGVHPAYGYCHGPGWGYGTTVDYVPYITRTVEFKRGRVSSWERTK